VAIEHLDVRPTRRSERLAGTRNVNAANRLAPAAKPGPSRFAYTQSIASSRLEAEDSRLDTADADKLSGAAWFADRLLKIVCGPVKHGSYTRSEVMPHTFHRASLVAPEHANQTSP